MSENGGYQKWSRVGHVCNVVIFCGLSRTFFEVQKLTNFSTPKMGPKIVNFGVHSKSIFGSIFWDPYQKMGGTKSEAESDTYAMYWPRLGNEGPKKWTPKWTPKWFHLEVHFRYRFEVPKSIDFGSILGSQNWSILGPLYFNTLHTCPHGKHILQTSHNKEREARWN